MVRKTGMLGNELALGRPVEVFLSKYEGRGRGAEWSESFIEAQ